MAREKDLKDLFGKGKLGRISNAQMDLDRMMDKQRFKRMEEIIEGQRKSQRAKDLAADHYWDVDKKTGAKLKRWKKKGTHSPDMHPPVPEDSWRREHLEGIIREQLEGGKAMPTPARDMLEERLMRQRPKSRGPVAKQYKKGGKVKSKRGGGKAAGNSIKTYSSGGYVEGK